MTDSQRQRDNGSSSIFKKLSPELRRQVDIAIVERVPPTFSAVWLEYELGGHGITYSAFYRYARRLRDRANAAEMVELTADDEPELDTGIQKLLSRRLLETLLNEESAAPNEITAIVAALGSLGRLKCQARNQAEKSRLDWARLELERERLRLRTENFKDASQQLQRFLSGSKADPMAQLPDLSGVEPRPPVRVAAPAAE